VIGKKADLAVTKENWVPRAVLRGDGPFSGWRLDMYDEDSGWRENFGNKQNKRITDERTFLRVLGACLAAALNNKLPQEQS
jgi:hypothetical protein